MRHPLSIASISLEKGLLWHSYNYQGGALTGIHHHSPFLCVTPGQKPGKGAWDTGGLEPKKRGRWLQACWLLAKKNPGKDRTSLTAPLAWASKERWWLMLQEEEGCGGGKLGRKLQPGPCWDIEGLGHEDWLPKQKPDQSLLLHRSSSLSLSWVSLTPPASALLTPNTNLGSTSCVLISIPVGCPCLCIPSFVLSLFLLFIHSFSMLQKPRAKTLEPWCLGSNASFASY